MIFNVYKDGELYGKADSFYNLAKLIISPEEDFIARTIELKDRFYLINQKDTREFYFGDYRVTFS